MWARMARRDGGRWASIDLAGRRARKRARTRHHDGPLADVGATVLRWLTGRDAAGLPGEAFTTQLEG